MVLVGRERFELYRPGGSRPHGYQPCAPRPERRSWLTVLSYRPIGFGGWALTGINIFRICRVLSVSKVF